MRYSQPRNSVSRFVPILLVIIMTAVAVAAVITIGRALFGDTPKPEEPKVDRGKEALLSVDASRAVRLTVRGPIVANEKFRSYSIVITPDYREIVTYEGYLDKTLEQRKLDNNTKAYTELIYALDKRKMMDGKELTAQQNDLRGICATGKLYKFETIQDSFVVKSLWTSDCGGSKGSALANVEEIVDMFQKQIPDGKKMANDIGLQQSDTLFKL